MDEIPVDVDNEINSQQESKESPLVTLPYFILHLQWNADFIREQTTDGGGSDTIIEEASTAVEVAPKEDLQDIKEEYDGEKSAEEAEARQIAIEQNETEEKNEEQDDQQVIENSPSAEQPMETRSQEDQTETTTVRFTSFL